MKKSAVVQALADIASQGTYQVRPEQARQMNMIFELAARVINELEEQEREEEQLNELLQEENAAVIAAEEEENDDSE